LLRENFDFVVFIDADCVVTNPSVEIEQYLCHFTAGKNILICEDEGGLNTGVLILRKNEEIFDLLSRVWNWDCDPYHPNWEQEALKRVIGVNPSVLEQFTILPPAHSFNKYPTERAQFHPSITNPINTWEPGDFLCHLSGIPSPYFEKILASYAK
jgi:hypothetical protein